MNIILTGATGYLGSHLLKVLLDLKHQVIVLKRTTSNEERIKEIIDHVWVVNIDKEPLEKAFKFFKIDLVLHTATCYGRKDETLSEVFSANTDFPLKLLELAINYKVDAFFNTDTFFNTETIQYSHLNNYALSKKQFQMWGESLALQHKIRFFNLRLQHMYGPGDASDKFINNIVKSFKDNISEIKLTKGLQKRDFIYIEDVVDAYMVLIDFLQFNSYDFFYQNIGVGTGDPISICELVKLAHKLAISSTKLRFGEIPLRKGEFDISTSDIKFLNQIGWKPKHSLQQGLLKLIEY